MSGLTVIPRSDLRAITVGQPWASLIAVGAKTIETRPRPTKHRGLVLVHAAAADTDRFMHRYSEAWNALGEEIGGAAPPRGAIVAVARIVQCLPVADGGQETTPEGPWIWRRRTELWSMLGGYQVGDLGSELPYGDYTPGRYALLLDDVTRLPRPVPAKGNQAVPWRVPADVAAQVREQVEGAA